MSDDFFQVIPTDPGFRPTDPQAVALLERVRQLVPDADEVETIDSPTVEFVDAGSNFGSVSCPACGAGLDVDWWGEQMDVAEATEFEVLNVTLPCCDAPSTLNDLAYDWPQGFARWHIDVRNPGRDEFDAIEVASLQAALSHDVRIIRSHI